MTVAALFVAPEGCYSNLPDVDAWPEYMDARKYPGPYPVVAHPPCARWCLLANLAESRWGIPVGADGGCFESALASVRKWGGVLEHPALTKAWPAYGLPTPSRGKWIKEENGPGYVTEVSQVAYGHLARKRTWLYYVGPPPPDLDWSEPPHKAWVGYADSGKYKGKVQRLSKRQRNATPVAFRDMLLELARACPTKDAALPRSP